MRKTVRTRDLEDASGFVIMQLLHLAYTSDMDSGTKKVIQRNLETIDWLIQSELNNRCNKKNID
jgi:hypothetical protein